MDTLTTPAMGHNQPPAYDPDVMADLAGRTDEFMNASSRIRKEFSPIQTEEHAQLLTDHVSGLRGLKKQVDDARKIAKKPFDEGAKAVQEAFNPLLDRIGRALDAMLEMQGDYLRRQAEKERARKAEEERIAREAQLAAEAKAAEAAKSGDIDAEAEAERLQKEADTLARDAARETRVNAGSATGAGRTISMVTLREAVITNINLLFVHYRGRAEVIDVLQRLANADLRAKDWNGTDIPGTTTKTREVAR